MKQNSTFIRRALILTAIAIVTAIAVGLPVFLLVDRHLAMQDARGELLATTRSMAAVVYDNADTFNGEATAFASLGGQFWLTDGINIDAHTEAALPAKASPLVEQALSGYEYLGGMHVGGRLNVVCVCPVRDLSGTLQRALVTCLPLQGSSRMPVSLILALLAGIVATALVLSLTVGPLFNPVLKSFDKLGSLIDDVAMGNFESEGDESAPGEIGRLNKGVNNISRQLAHSMYALIIERNRLVQVLNGLSEGIVAMGKSGEITHANPAVERLFPKRNGVITTDARMKLIPDADVWSDFDHAIATGESVARNFEVRDMTLRLTVSPTTDESGVIAGAVGLFSDITQMERLERTRREYVSNVSHELRTPLTAIRALVEPMKEGLVNQEADRMRYYDIILREVMRLSRLINDQLELSRLQSGTLSIEKSVITLDDLVYDVCDRYVAIAADKGLTLNVPDNMDACPSVYGNADRVEELLVILVDNAIKYTEKGSVTVGAAWDDEKVTLSVTDTGIGIAETDLPYVFDRFYKVDKAHSGKGSGLGLSIAMELTKMLGEQITVESEQGVGTTFRFTIHRKAA